MAAGGTRFRGSQPRAAPAVIDVDVRPKHETLYDVLVVPKAASTREIRKVARMLRRNLPETSELHDICLAEQVLGRSNQRAEYDALLARLEAAGQPVPKIGPAIEGERLGPSFGERVGHAGRAGVSAAGRLFRGLIRASFVILVLVVIGIIIASEDGGGSRSRSYPEPYKIPDLKPLQMPRLDPELYRFRYKPIEVPKIEIPKIEIPKYEFMQRAPIKVPKIQIPKIEVPKYELMRRVPIERAAPKILDSGVQEPEAAKPQAESPPSELREAPEKTLIPGEPPGD